MIIDVDSLFFIFILFKATTVHYARIQLMVEHNYAKPDTEAILLTSEEQRTKLKKTEQKRAGFQRECYFVIYFSFRTKKFPSFTKFLHILLHIDVIKQHFR
jgi:hypothetical protein